mmetsp:Transcript_25840/g.72372  ORF Transcript_25840/g.72372 Transcript_25840/m.72372 type:complete len:221 (+) Transcript_25840:1653-2315(+)
MQEHFATWHTVGGGQQNAWTCRERSSLDTLASISSCSCRILDSFSSSRACASSSWLLAADNASLSLPAKVCWRSANACCARSRAESASRTWDSVARAASHAADNANRAFSASIFEATSSASRSSARSCASESFWRVTFISSCTESAWILTASRRLSRPARATDSALAVCLACISSSLSSEHQASAAVSLEYREDNSWSSSPCSSDRLASDSASFDCSNCS